MKSWPFVLGTLLTVPVGAGSGEAQTNERVTFRIQPERSKLVVHLFKEGVGSRFAHDHVVIARALNGTIKVEPQRPETAQIDITVFTDGLNADPAELRRAYGMPALGDDDRRKINGSMRSEGQLDTARHRTIKFASSRITATGNGSIEIHGQLTIRGVTRPVSLHAKASVSGPTLKGSGKLTFRQSDFGYKPYKAMLGLVRVRDQAEMDIHIEAMSAAR